jgi:sulfoquinovose isomerase
MKPGTVVQNMPAQAPASGWLGNRGHQQWLLSGAHRLIDFFQHAVMDPAGGFFELDDEGNPFPGTARHIVTTTRMTHTFALAHLLGHPGAGVLADHGIRSLTTLHRDPDHGGYFWIAGREGADHHKQAYGHVHVLLAASSALVAGRPGAAELLSDVWSVLQSRFGTGTAGLLADEYERDWKGPTAYRGQNCNMHFVEALLAAHDATGDRAYLVPAGQIASKLIAELTAANHWRLAEHYTEGWQIDPEFGRDDPESLFWPYGSIVGHWMEWARLLLQLREALGLSGKEDWMLPAARRLFSLAIDEGWDARIGGFIYTVEFDGRPFNRDRYWWTHAEAIGAAAVLAGITGEPEYERWYRTFWDFVETHFIDHRRGGWYPQLDRRNAYSATPWKGKPDLYHSLQAYLFPLVPAARGLAVSLGNGAVGGPAAG